MTASPGTLRRSLLAALAIGCVALQFGGSLVLSLAALGVWLASLAVAAPAQLKRLWMPRFWAVSIVFALASGLLLGKPDLALGPVSASRAGLEAGLLMVVRGVFVFALMGWASRLVVDDDVQSAIRRMGFAQFGGALSAALALLPSLAERVRPAMKAGRGAGFLGRPRLLHAEAVALVRHTALLARSLQAAGSARLMAAGPAPAVAAPPARLVAAVVGPPGSGKTTLVHAALARLRAGGVRVGGVTQPAIGEAGKRTGYRLRDAATGEEIAFALRGERGFSFSDEGWQWAGRRLTSALSSAECVALDELGRLESRGEGHLAALALPAVPAAPQALLLAVREEFAGEISRQLGAFALTVAPTASPTEVDRFVSALQEYLRPN